MGISPIAVYSQIDTSALHVNMADEAYLIGPSAPHESYLNIPALIEAALATGADAIHPGYGFLSENAEFARAVEAAGLVFIGPTAEVIQRMGDKLEAKALARAAGVCVIPGGERPATTAQDVKALGDQLGYPLLLKAAAGGGGKGMRVVQREDQIEEFLQRTSHEALSSFGDGRVFVEKFIESPRHIEIQILADTHGNIVHLGERDCSLQRRHQKVIEECPSPFLTSSLRAAMVEQAVSLCRKVGYTSAGTVEFVVTPTREFYFLEMNTRLQVEHPVTEMVTGLDLVEQMIRIAAGESLSFTQSDLRFSGHAIEARLYAEDPEQDFLPSSGRITRFEAPPLNKDLRLDTGVEAGSEVSIYYDPMLAKLVSFAPNRLEAIQNLKSALAQFIIDGPTHNLGFLEQLLGQSQMIAGDFTTEFIAHNMRADLTLDQKNLVKAIATLIYRRLNPSDQAPVWIVVDQEEGTSVSVDCGAVFIDGDKIDFELDWCPKERRFSFHSNGEIFYGKVHLSTTNLMIQLFGVESCFQVMSPRQWDLFSHVKTPQSQPDNLIITAPMPGILISVPISVGDLVKQGQPLLVIEAMKMENVLKSPTDATVAEILIQPGDTLRRGQQLVRLK
jgi:propionyl-CoA carboxylase alpha chain